MQIIGSIYLCLLLVSALVSLVIAWAAWVRRGYPGALPLLGVAVSLIILSISSGMEALALQLPAKVFWLNIQQIGYGFMPVCYFIMVVQYLGLTDQITPRRIACLMLVPLITIALSFTNDAHYLIRFGLHESYGGGLSFVGKTYGLWQWVQIVYSYILMTVSIGLLLHPRMQAHGYFRDQTRALLWSLLIPFTTSLLYVLHVSLSRHMDLTPAMASFSAVIIVLRVLRYRLFEIVPVARTCVVDSMSEGVLALDQHDRVVDLNPSCIRLLGLTPAAIGMPVAAALWSMPEVLSALRHDAPPESELQLSDHEGERWLELRLTPLQDRQGQIIGRLALFHDITAHKRAQLTISHLAYHDFLTDLPNRELFSNRLQQELARARRNHGRVALLVLDLDNFKEVNDTYGHFTGDLLLREVANRLRGLVREEDMVCRLGGDEFAVLLVDITGFHGAQSMADRLRAALAQTSDIDGHALNATTSIGIAIYPDDGVLPETLFRRADEAMYRNKRARKARRRREYATTTNE